MKNKMLILFFIILYISAFSYVKLYNGWEYRWEDESAWHEYKTPGVPIENKNKMLYLRYKLPDVKLDTPAIYLTGIFDNSSMKVEDTLIYNTFAKSFFSPKSIFKIPEDFQNKYLIIKVSSKRRDVGFFGEFLLGNEIELLRHQIFVELDKILLVVFSFFILIISFILYLYFLIFQRSSEIRKALIYLGIFSSGIGIFISGQTQTFKYFFSNYIFWAYMMDVGKYLSPIGLMGFFYNIFDYSTKKIIKILLYFHIIYFSTISIIQIANGFEYNYYVDFSTILYFAMLLDIIIMIYNIYIGYKLKDFKAYIFSGAIILVSFFAIYEIMGDLRIIKWQRPLIQWSIFFLINSMILLILKNIKELNLELSVKNKILESWNKDLEEIISKRTKDIKILLDNSGEGFFSFDKNFIVKNEYSKECIRIFARNIEGINAIDLLFDTKDKDFVKRVFDDVFNEKDKFKKEVYLSFLPSELKINNGYYEVFFKFIDHEEIIMVKLKDITTEKNLQLKINEEKENLAKIVEIIKNYDTFVLNITGIKKLIKSLLNMDIKHYKTFFGEIHNYKGIFSQFYLKNIAHQLHEIESKILNNTLQKDAIKKLEKLLNTEISNIQKELGHKIDEDILKIPKIKILEIEKELKQHFDKNHHIIKEIEELRYKNLSQLIKPYLLYTKELAKKEGKTINEPKLIERDIILVDPEKYFSLIKSLINIFRNIISHGIETPEMRIEKGKDDFGNIEIHLYKENNNINIIIKDDGAGIDLDKLKVIAKSKNIKYNNKEDLLNLIFMEFLTTSEKTTEISGRGIGLSIVKKEVEKLGGKIYVKSEYNKGTSFHIIIPEVI
ncbi:hypothetical protein X275_04175 [Marinitoga sp. 1197]|uniref:ATP-binding protein n=1 Tax=Marinitoga sp. 1197 TaxID=1428449 RepID=UPI000641643C|nr:ATP-binding protein [Marinitoga sp. 1197]KLO23055.1 hypothetical protein X275_04175 [Marinitoga sp. 1197]